MTAAPQAGAGQGLLLVVEDDATMRRAVERVLKPYYKVRGVGTIAEAQACLAETSVEMALVDVQLPDGDGYSLTDEIQRRGLDTDVILMTGSVSSTDESLYRSLEQNAFFFLFKPFERRVLLALVERCLRLRRERRAKEAFARQARTDLEQARRFQHSLLPREALAEQGWRLSGRFLPCDALGGDFYQAQIDLRGGLIVSVSDVVGHGVSAAMIAGMVRSALDAARRKDPEPGRLMAELASGVDFLVGPRFVTLVYCQLFDDGRLRYANAGHPPPLWLSGGAPIVELRATGPILKTELASFARPARDLRLAVGDRLLLYSDGLFEARDPTGRELGIAGVGEALAALADRPLEAALDGLLARLDEHRAGRPLEDDVTLVLVERTGAPAAG